MIFCRFADCVFLREISNGLRSANGNLDHLGISRAPSKSNLADQNEKRSCVFFRDCYYTLLNHFGQQVRFPSRKFRFNNAAYALGSTIVTLCAEVYDWARYTHSKGAVGLHTLLNFSALLPEYVYVTDGKVADNTAARHVEVKPGSIVVSDRGYFDTLLLNFWDSIHHHTALCPTQAAGCIQVALLKPRIIAKAQHIYQNRPVSMDKQSLNTTA